MAEGKEEETRLLAEPVADDTMTKLKKILNGYPSFYLSKNYISIYLIDHQRHIFSSKIYDMYPSL